MTREIVKMQRHHNLVVFLGLLASLSTIRCVKVDFVDCESQAIVYYVDIQGCSNDYEGASPPADEVCVVQRGASIHGEVQFESGFDAEYLDCEIFGIINGLEEPFPGTCTQTGDVCLDLAQGDCPIEEGEMVLYEIDMSVLPSYPTIECQAKWTLLDELENVVLCFEIEIEILP